MIHFNFTRKSPYCSLEITILIFSLFFYSIFYPLSFNYEETINFHYYFFSAISLSVLAVTFLVTKNKEFRFVPLIIILLAYASIGFLSPSNEVGFNLLSFVMYGILFYELNTIYPEKKVPLFVFFSFFFIQIIIGYTQFFVNEGSGILSVTGGFGNSGIFASGLVIMLPLILHFISSLNQNFVRISLYTLSILAVLFIIFLTSSRSALLGFIGILTYYVVSKKQFFFIYFKKIRLLPLILALFLFTIILNFNSIIHFKQLSATGRLLIWKISILNFTDNFLFGIGLGKYDYYYPIWQSNYFKTHRVSQTISFPAGETYVAFNEPLSYLIELGLLLFLLITVPTFVYITKKSHYNSVEWVIKLTLWVAFICSLTTYVFHSNLILIYLSYIISQVFFINRGKLPEIFNKVISSRSVYIFLFFCSLMLVRFIPNSYRIAEWQMVRKNHYGRSPQEVSKSYTFLYKHLRFEPKFLLNYASHVHDNENNPDLVLKLLNEAKKSSSLTSIYELLGCVYSEDKNYREAIFIYFYLSYLIPSKFFYKYKLMENYKLNNELIKAKCIARTILTMPVKVPSQEVEEIKGQARAILLLN